MSYHLQEINRRIQADPKEFVDASDAAYAAKIERAARAIADNAHTCPIVLLSGPSGSGKTTTAMKIAEALCKLGVGSQSLAMDDYFRTVDLRTAPRTPEGDLLVLRAHAAAREAIKTICPEVKVGLTLSLHDLQAQPGGEAFAAAAWEEEFTHYLPYIKEDDFLGVQNYTRTLYGAHGQLPAPQGAELTQMDYEFYPQALENVIRKVAQDFHGDLIVTENGIATADDTRRVAFIEAALAGVQNCIADGIPVKGYFHWSLMDNFEWQKGYAMNFGLIAVNRETMGRTPKPSLAALGGYANA